VEARILLPAGAGFVPAFWMMPADDRYGWWPCSGEIDIMEHPTTVTPPTIYGTAHARSYSSFTGSAPKSGSVQLADAELAYHVYAVEWTPDTISYFVDQSKYFSVTNDHGGSASWPFDQPFYIILNLAVGGGWVGAPPAGLTFPITMSVDYVRAYQYVPDTQIAGPDFPYLNTLGATYTMPAISGASYEWTVPSPAVLASGQGTRSATVNWGVTGGSMTCAVTGPAGATTASMSVTVSNNLLRNPGFEKGVKYWKTAGSSGAMIPFDLDSTTHAPGNRSAKAIITNLPANPWDIQMTQSGFALTSGKQYELKVTARADSAGRKCNVSVINAQNYTVYGSVSLTLSTTWTTYTTQFTMAQSVPATLSVDLGVHTGTYYLDDFSVIDLSTKTNVEAGQENSAPALFILEQNYPNPFNPKTVVSCQLPMASWVKLIVCDLLGREVKVLMNEKKEPGRYEVQFDGSRLGSGVYLYRMQAGDFVQTRKLLLLR